MTWETGYYYREKTRVIIIDRRHRSLLTEREKVKNSIISAEDAVMFSKHALGLINSAGGYRLMERRVKTAALACINETRICMKRSQFNLSISMIILRAAFCPWLVKYTYLSSSLVGSFIVNNEWNL